MLSSPMETFGTVGKKSYNGMFRKRKKFLQPRHSAQSENDVIEERPGREKNQLDKAQLSTKIQGPPPTCTGYQPH